jgi:hypothetical protein
MDLNFMESVWWVFSQLYAKDLVYKGFKVFLISINFELFVFNIIIVYYSARMFEMMISLMLKLLLIQMYNIIEVE